jgi:signal peptidase I
VVVFNFPAGDTVIHATNFESLTPYYDVKRRAARGVTEDQVILTDPENYPIVVHPVDKSDNYIKRCVGTSGDTIQIKYDVVYINGKQEASPPNSELNYIVETYRMLDPDSMRMLYNVDPDKNEYRTDSRPNTYRMLLTAKAKDDMLKNNIAKTIVADTTLLGGDEVFPYDAYHTWSRDNFGPVWIPKKGGTLKLTPQNYAIYERAISKYEKNDLYQKDGKFFLNGKKFPTIPLKWIITG